MWTRGWRTSLPRGSSQKHCRKPGGCSGPLTCPAHTSPQGFSSLHANTAGPSAKGMLGKAAHSRILSRARLGEEEWDGSHGVQDVAVESVPQWRGNEAAPMGTMLGMGGLVRTLLPSGGVSRVWIHPFRVGREKNLISYLLAAWSSPFPMLHFSPAPRVQRPAWDQPLWLPLVPAPSRRKLGIFLPSRNPNPAGAQGVRRSLRVVPLPLGAGAQCSVTFYEPPARRVSQGSP